MKPNTLGFLGLLRKGGGLYLGEDCFSQIGRVSLLILASDAGKDAAKRALDKAKSHQIPLLVGEGKEQMGHALGVAKASLVGVKSPKAAKKILEDETAKGD